ncbi:type IV pilus modification PilV family protein [Geomonas sp.]|uniref:type IV pilus modification PilV family protein n=1 Tax=Geomonas sp. TaxID=2651584 RepID=UPI002B46D930|nr:prepilin-type N-terminal cleavage/methylation domain-containing protein [Geomonas sp.]HJV36913.1 prepilin-type N-terminal cleavage/methylation domain-containing protein [Geomonas sp.]
MTASLKSSSGFTLIEMVMAMLVLSVGLLGLLQSIQVALRHEQGNKVREEAVLLAEEQMNVLRLNPFDTHTTATRMIGGGLKKFSVVRTTRSLGETTSTSQLTVSVSWQFRNLTTTHQISTFKKI